MKYVACGKCGKEYHGCSVQKCPNRAVISRYGVDICMYCCQKCKNNIHQGAYQLCALKEKTRLKKKKAEQKHLEKSIEKDAFNCS